MLNNSCTMEIFKRQVQASGMKLLLLSVRVKYLALSSQFQLVSEANRLKEPVAVGTPQIRYRQKILFSIRQQNLNFPYFRYTFCFKQEYFEQPNDQRQGKQRVRAYLTLK